MTTSIGPTYLGVDVGTGSARAGVFDARGVMLAAASEPIQLWRPQGDFVEQSSDDIWAACCRAVRAAIADANVAPAGVRGIGFDATCSLAAVDAHGRPVSISPTGRDEQNVVVWMDHRAIPQAARINATGHAVLRYVGGVISPEMQTPKLLWLRENLPATWRRAARFFDLPDYLTYRATGDDTRSLCTTSASGPTSAVKNSGIRRIFARSGSGISRTKASFASERVCGPWANRSAAAFPRRPPRSSD